MEAKERLSEETCPPGAPSGTLVTGLNVASGKMPLEYVTRFCKKEVI